MISSLDNFSARTFQHDYSNNPYIDTEYISGNRIFYLKYKIIALGHYPQNVKYIKKSKNGTQYQIPDEYIVKTEVADRMLHCKTKYISANMVLFTIKWKEDKAEWEVSSEQSSSGIINALVRAHDEALLDEDYNNSDGILVDEHEIGNGGDGLSRTPSPPRKRCRCYFSYGESLTVDDEDFCTTYYDDGCSCLKYKSLKEDRIHTFNNTFDEKLPTPIILWCHPPSYSSAFQSHQSIEKVCGDVQNQFQEGNYKPLRVFIKYVAFFIKDKKNGDDNEEFALTNSMISIKELSKLFDYIREEFKDQTPLVIDSDDLCKDPCELIEEKFTEDMISWNSERSRIGNLGMYGIEQSTGFGKFIDTRNSCSKEFQYPPTVEEFISGSIGL
ncbi:hypothetical protein Glove_141g53 [Diversispora epigaea]|uniref:Uncharacterized protein n=1 Tax=Diversispora epigaea TaxID=1348612 RepID=A0A397J3W9_9GLOM|nr:hypothetical protein Glove_141g53 [Diversispora epigaea]